MLLDFLLSRPVTMIPLFPTTTTGIWGQLPGSDSRRDSALRGYIRLAGEEDDTKASNQVGPRKLEKGTIGSQLGGGGRDNVMARLFRKVFRKTSHERNSSAVTIDERQFLVGINVGASNDGIVDG